MSTLAVLAVVVLLVLWYMFYCWRSVRSDEAGTYLTKLWDPLSEDVEHRLVSGRDPDWARYLEEASRRHEDLREKLRNYGTISLATGVGGTMLALALYLLTSRGEAAPGDVSRLPEMLQEMGWALVASFTGVLGNLVILWGLLPWAHRRFNPGIDEFIERLRILEGDERRRLESGALQADAATGSQIDEKVLSAVSELPDALNKIGNAADVFSTATATLHEDAGSLTSASTALTQAVLVLSRAPTELNAGIGTTLDGLMDKTDATNRALKEATSQYAGAADLLSRTGEKIVTATDALPQSVSVALEKSGDAFRLKFSEMLEPQLNRFGDAFLEASSHHKEVADRFRVTGDQIAAVTERLPERFGAEVVKSGEALQRNVTEELAPHLAQFRDGVNDGLNKLLEWQRTMEEQLSDTRAVHENAIHELKNSIASVRGNVAELPVKLAQGIDKISDQLGREFGYAAEQHVEKLTRILKEDAERLRRELERHESHLLNTTVEELKAVSQQLINETVRDLNATSDRLAEVIKDFPEHLEAANERLKVLEAQLTTVVNQTTENSTALRSAHKQTDQMLAKVAASASGLTDAIQKLAIVLVRPPFWSRWWKGFSGRFSKKQRILDDQEETRPKLEQSSNDQPQTREVSSGDSSTPKRGTNRMVENPSTGGLSSGENDQSEVTRAPTPEEGSKAGHAPAPPAAETTVSGSKQKTASGENAD